MAGTLNPVLSSEARKKLELAHAPKHAGSISIVNYKGGVSKTTITCLLGYYLANLTKKKVLLFDIDPQCSLSLALGFNPEEVSHTELTVYNLVKPSKWTKITKTNFENYVQDVRDRFAPKNLRIVPGSFDTDDLDMTIATRIAEDKSLHQNQQFLYCKRLSCAYDKYDYILVDCPPNKMFLTQAMLRACSYYLTVTIPDAISIYGMPRLLRWINQIPKSERPLSLGYVLNALNRSGGAPGGKVYSQQQAEARLIQSIQNDLQPVEKKVLGSDVCTGALPRLDAIAIFLGEQDAKSTRFDFPKRTSGQPSVDECLTAKTVMKRIADYRA
ncbi:MAG: ParA family protein [Candidatus Binataceae bacterium]